MRKKSVLFLMILVVCAGMAFAQGSAEKKADDGHYLFGATYMTMNNPFFVYLNDGIKGIVEAKGDKLVAYDPALDQAKQIAQIEDMIAQGVDAIFLNPVDWQGVRPALDAAKAAGIPIINVDAPVFDEDLVDCIVASNNYNAGVLVAQDVMKRLKSAKIVLLEHPTAKSAIDRTQSFVDTVKNFPQYEIIARQSSNGQIEQAMPVMENIIQAQDKIDVVMGLNDPTAIGALAALEAAKRSANVLIYGVDGSPDAKKMVNEGRMTATAAQSPIGSAVRLPMPPTVCFLDRR
ncbi:sugar ABC transporter substrate-binding protein [uncultured Sphaerochaeta sp.]|uniref:sugar ABC transporter substrate-binding protein n=1 Tax=uncultured Sphaerochaeta sp. TaxID=886478 RepID=UPI002A0A311B|nr:sugar ABC transporter substrate-binding protein [uncultured Sphaerochaeta sp.]